MRIFDATSIDATIVLCGVGETDAPGRPARRLTSHASRSPSRTIRTIGCTPGRSQAGVAQRAELVRCQRPKLPLQLPTPIRWQTLEAAVRILYSRTVRGRQVPVYLIPVTDPRPLVRIQGLPALKT